MSDITRFYVTVKTTITTGEFFMVHQSQYFSHTEYFSVAGKAYECYRNGVYRVSNEIELAFPDFNARDFCSFLVSGKCPIAVDTDVTENISLQVSKLFPVVSLHFLLCIAKKQQQQLKMCSDLYIPPDLIGYCH